MRGSSATDRCPFPTSASGGHHDDYPSSPQTATGLDPACHDHRAVVVIPIPARLARDWYEGQKWEGVKTTLMDELEF